MWSNGSVKLTPHGAWMQKLIGMAELMIPPPHSLSAQGSTLPIFWRARRDKLDQLPI